MKILLLYPEFQKSFWSFEKTIALMGKKAFMPPLGLVTIAAILPQTWEFRLVDQNVQEVGQDDWEWADLVMISGMIAQRRDFMSLIKRAKTFGKPVAVGGPFVSSSPELFEAAGADFIVRDEGEITLPLLVQALEAGQASGVFTSDGEKPDIASTPVPRYDLLEMDAYSVMPVQFSRGCPFNCEFCDIIVLYGRKVRTKTNAQVLAELDRLYELGWRDMIFLVDDNFIGNKRRVKELLTDLHPWLVEKGYPFSFNTEASVNLASDQELMDLMVLCNFGSVFVGIETPDQESLEITGKVQNTRTPLLESVNRITRSGIRVMAGFIIGFDNESKGAGERIVSFVEAAAIPIAAFSMLQVLPGTALETRLRKEGRLSDRSGDINYTTLLNFTPSRPVQDIATEFMDGFWQLYDPSAYINRVYRCYRILGEVDWPSKNRRHNTVGYREIRAICLLFWRLGVQYACRKTFWCRLAGILKHNPGGLASYLSVLGQLEHFMDYRQRVRIEIQEQLGKLS